MIPGTGTASYSGDGSAGTSAALYYPSGVAVDNMGNLYIADSNNNRIRKVLATGIITTIAGNRHDMYYVSYKNQLLPKYLCIELNMSFCCNYHYEVMLGVALSTADRTDK